VLDMLNNQVRHMYVRTLRLNAYSSLLWAENVHLEGRVVALSVAVMSQRTCTYSAQNEGHTKSHKRHFTNELE